VTRKQLTIILLWLGLLLTRIPVLAEDNSWTIMINIPEYRLFLYHNGALLKTYKVAVGKNNSPSPTGEFRIINKVVNPTWYPEKRAAIPPGPQNPLGKYWMGLDSKGYGIHGNSAPWSIGAPASRGCFRMDNEAIKELFTLVPLGTLVKVNYDIIKCKIDNYNQAWLEIFPDIYHRFKLETRVQQALAELDWKYVPHQKALSTLITAKKPLLVMIPRKVSIGGDYREQELDGFYWNGRVYLSRQFLESNFPAIINYDQVFSQFSSWDLDGMSELVREALNWNDNFNLISVRTLKVLLNDEKLNDAGRFGNQGEPQINYSKINNWFADKQLPKPKLIATIPDGSQFSDDNIENLWVEPKVLTVGLNGFSHYFDETSLTVFIYYNLR